MFNKELKFISDLNLNKLQDLGSKFNLQAVKNSNIHPSLYKYIDAAVELEILQDRITMQENSKFDYSGERIGNYFSLITKEIKRIKTFDLSYISTLLQKAIVFNANYLTRPNHTLVQFIYSDKSVRSIDELLVFLSHAYYYRYLQKILLTYFDKKKVLKLSKEEFATLLLRVDAISRNTHLYDTIDTAINSMANFFDPSLNSSERVPLEAVRLYLKEKGLDEFLTNFNNKFGPDNNSFQLTSEIQSILKAVIPEEEVELKSLSKTKEDEFVNEEETKNIEPDEKVNEKLNYPEKEIENNRFNNDEIEQPEIIEPTETIVNSDDDYNTIENHEILSDNKIFNSSPEFNEYTEENSVVNNEDSLVKTPTREKTELNEKIDDEETEVIVEKEEVVKEIIEKPQTKGLLKKIINLLPFYDSLLKKQKPFENSIDNENYEKEVLSSDDDLTKYQMDISNLEDEMTISPDNDNTETLAENEIDEHANIAGNEEINSQESLLLDNENSNDEENNFEIGEKIDEVVTDQKYEDEFINQVADTEKINNDLEEVKEISTDILEDDKFKLLEEEDKEITEVFTDLSFLDSREEIITENVNPDQTIELVEDDENNKIENDDYEDNNNYNDGESVTVVYSDFKEMLNKHDMTSIIEAVFDYDMEDYHGIIDRISNSTNQMEALEITDKYLNENHIDSSLKDVAEFKNLISNYFSQSSS